MMAHRKSQLDNPSEQTSESALQVTQERDPLVGPPESETIDLKDYLTKLTFEIIQLK